MKNPTLRYLAKELGLGLSTVSKALRDHSEVALETRQRVKEFADKVGYKPDPRIAGVMRHMKQKREDKARAAIGYITNFPKGDQLENYPIFNNYYLGAKQRASELGYHLERFNVRADGMSESRLTSILYNRGIEGVIIPPTHKKWPDMNLDLQEFSCLALGFSYRSEKIDRVTLDHYSSVMNVLSELAARGYRRIGYAVLERANERTQFRWVAAYCAFHYQNPKQESIDLYLGDPNDEVRFMEWFESNKPDVIISSHVEWVPFLYARGLRCPEDFGYVHLEREALPAYLKNCLDGDLSSDFSNCTGVDQKSFQTGCHAVNILSNKMSRNVRGTSELAKVTLVQGDWIEGSTIRVPDR